MEINIEKYKNLKKAERHSKEKWTIENIRDGFEYFYELNGRYPASEETDRFEYLPSRKSIERSFGGMVNIRKTLNLSGAKDFTRGKTRSKKAREAFLRSQNYEEKFYKYLSSKIAEVRIHEHKIMRPGDTACDFFVYTCSTRGIFIDLFYAQDMHSLRGVVAIKTKKCLNVTHPVYFVLVENDKINQKQLDELNSNRKTLLPKHILVVTEDFFIKNVLEILKLESINC
jgi:hypothetical protein